MNGWNSEFSCNLVVGHTGGKNHDTEVILCSHCTPQCHHSGSSAIISLDAQHQRWWIIRLAQLLGCLCRTAACWTIIKSYTFTECRPSSPSLQSGSTHRETPSMSDYSLPSILLCTVSTGDQHQVSLTRLIQHGDVIIDDPRLMWMPDCLS